MSEAADLSSIQLCLLDTPGPNEAGEEGLKYQVCVCTEGLHTESVCLSV